MKKKNMKKLEINPEQNVHDNNVFENTICS